tara:strand:- start:515 stop:895 length:381 start_codon:yes stop_codon:yes gene_type:complete
MRPLIPTTPKDWMDWFEKEEALAKDIKRLHSEQLWTPTKYDLEWTKNLYRSLKTDGGVWMFGTGEMSELVDTTNATFTRFGDKMELTNIRIKNPLKGEILKDRINKAQACFQKLGIQCIVDLENIR